jgi:hypothetical protein
VANIDDELRRISQVFGDGLNSKLAAFHRAAESFASVTRNLDHTVRMNEQMI